MSTPTRRAIAERLLELASSGELGPEMIIPPEQSLAERVAVSRPTLRAALCEMEDLGMLSPRSGRKRSVAITQTSNRHDLIASTVMILGDFSPRQHCPNDFVNDVGFGLFERLSRLGISTFVQRSDNFIKTGGVRAIIRGRPRGCLILPNIGDQASQQHIATELQRAGIPFVILNNTPQHAAFHVVDADHKTGGYLLTRWLIENGATRILRYFTADARPETSPIAAQRNAGYIQAIQEAGIDQGPIVHGAMPTHLETAGKVGFLARVRLCAGYLIEHMNTIDGIIAPDDSTAARIASACRLCGRRPGEDIWITGYGNDWQTAPERRWTTAPPSATIENQGLQVGRRGAEILMEQLHEGREPRRVCELIRPKIIVI